MRAEFGDDPRLRFFIGSVDDERRVTEALEGVEYVVHAAAMKRVDTCHENPVEALLTNAIGTVNVARGCKAQNVHKAVFLSTDKAAAPFTHYGVTKLAAEATWLSYNVYTPRQRTRFSATRYGNVIGSRGSVVPLFKDQARLGGPLTITDPRMTRFWMRMEQAIELVQLAFREMEGGEVFVPKIAASSVLDMAEAIGPGIQTRITGIRAGEKLHETLICEFEARNTYDFGDHYRINPSEAAMHAGTKVPDDFTYTSSVPTIDVPTLGRLVA